MQYHLVLTEHVTSSAPTAGERATSKGLPLAHTNDIDDLIKFFRQHPEPVIGFYDCEIIP